MIPLSFDPDSARKTIGDAWARLIEAKARADADARAFDPPALAGHTYWDQVQAEMGRIVYHEQFSKRTQRNKRKQLIADKHGD